MANLEPQEIEKIIEKVVKENTISSELDYQRMLVKAGYQAYADKIKLTEGDGINYLLDQLNLNYYYALKLKNVIDNRHWSRRQTKYDSEAIATLSKDLMNIANGLFELREKVNTSLISPQLLKKNEEIERLKKEANQKDNHAVEAIQQATDKERERIEIQHIDAINDYVKGKISFERCAEILDINFYELAEFCTVRRQALQGER
jgi:predicted HTH domain antitoxin